MGKPAWATAEPQVSRASRHGARPKKGELPPRGAEEGHQLEGQFLGQGRRGLREGTGREGEDQGRWVVLLYSSGNGRG